MLTTKQINDSFIKCRIIAESIYGDKVPKMRLEINYRFGQRTLGMCSFRQGKDPLIQINPKLPIEKLDNTMVHEIAHAICGAGVGHSPQWKKVGDMIGLALGTTVSRTSKVAWEYTGQRYTVSCPGCGYKWYKTKASNVTKYPSNYSCKCGHWGLVCTQHY